MQTETTLSPDDYHVFAKIPAEWWDENFVGAEIAQVLRLTSGNVLRRISRLVRLGIVERRHTERGPVTSEIRRIAKI